MNANVPNGRFSTALRTVTAGHQGAFIFEVGAGSGAIQVSSQRVQGIISPVVKRLGREGVRSPYLVLRLRMSGALPLLPLYAFMEWTGTTKG